MRTVLAIVSLTCQFLMLTATAWADARPDFAVIQPGQPGTTEEAQPVMNELAAYLRAQLPTETAVAGRYFNELPAALEYLRAARPSWGIVSLSFYLEYAEEFEMVPLASTQPAGAKKDIWRLVTSRDGTDDWRQLSGKVFGTVLHETDAAACVFFERRAKNLPFRLVGTNRPLRVLRSVAKGETSAIVLDRRQFSAVSALPLASQIKVIHTSSELPTSPVVSFGANREQAPVTSLVSVLESMSGDPEAQDLLRLLQTSGFGPPDTDLAQLQMERNGGTCPP